MIGFPYKVAADRREDRIPVPVAGVAQSLIGVIIGTGEDDLGAGAVVVDSALRAETDRQQIRRAYANVPRVDRDAFMAAKVGPLAPGFNGGWRFSVEEVAQEQTPEAETVALFRPRFAGSAWPQAGLNPGVTAIPRMGPMIDLRVSAYAWTPHRVTV